MHLLAWLFDERRWDRLDEVMDPEVEAYGFSGLEAVVAGSLRPLLGGCGPSQHLLGNCRIDVEGDGARSTTQVRAAHQGAGERVHLFFDVMGFYEDTWARRAEGWRMTARRMEVRIAQGDPDVLQPG